MEATRLRAKCAVVHACVAGAYAQKRSWRTSTVSSTSSLGGWGSSVSGWRGSPCMSESAQSSMPAKGAMCPRCFAWWCKDELRKLGCRRCIERVRVKWTLQKLLPGYLGTIVFGHLWLANEFSLGKGLRRGYSVHDHRCRCGQCSGIPRGEGGRRRIVHRWRVVTFRTRVGKSAGINFGIFGWLWCVKLDEWFVWETVDRLGPNSRVR